MKKFEVIEIEYDKLREDLKSNCEELIEQNDILFNYDAEQDQYIAFVKFDPQRARSLGHKPRGSDVNTRILRRKRKNFVSKKYGIFNDFPFKQRTPKEKSPDQKKVLIKGSKRSPSVKKKPKVVFKPTTEQTQAVFHESCLKSEIKSRSKVKRIKGSTVYRPSHRGRSADLVRRINQSPGKPKKRLPRRSPLKDTRGYAQVGRETPGLIKRNDDSSQFRQNRGPAPLHSRDYRKAN